MSGRGFLAEDPEPTGGGKGDQYTHRPHPSRRVLYVRLQEKQSWAGRRQAALDFGVKEIRARNLRRIAVAESLFAGWTSGPRSMLQELEAEVGRRNGDVASIHVSYPPFARRNHWPFARSSFRSNRNRIPC
jgi:hypothetical protein